MELFSKNYDTLNEEIKKLLEEFNHHHNYQETSYIFLLLYTMIFFNNYNEKEKINYTHKLSKNYHHFQNKLESQNKRQKYFLKDFINNKEFYQKFLYLFLDNEKEIYMPADDYLYDDNFLTETDMYEIAIDFLKNYHPTAINLFNELISNKRLYLLDKDNQYDCQGISIYNFLYKSYFVFIANDNDINSLISIMHELGHIIDDINIPINTPNKEIYDYHFKSTYIEVISSMYEKEFIDFLIKENINPKVASLYLTNYYQTMYDDFECLNLLSYLPNSLLQNEKYKTKDKFKITEALLENPDIYFEQSEFLNPNILDLKTHLNYGYGKFFATYFSSLRKESYSDFQSQFSKFLTLRLKNLDSDIFKNLGTTMDLAISQVESEINQSSTKIKIKSKQN